MTSPIPGEERFRFALRWLGPIEGGWWPGGPRDPNPTMRGVTQRVYDVFRTARGLPTQSVRHLSNDEHDAIYREEYWLAGGCPTLPWPLGLVHFDACVNHGVGRARKLLAKLAASGPPTPGRYIALRRAFYRAIVDRNPNQAPNAPGWERRMVRLASLTERL